MLATSTHDNKRSEDVRTRIDVLSEMPAAWRLALRRWRNLNRRHRSEVDGASAPSPNDEYLLYQTLLGAWPLEPLDDASLAALRARIQAYMLKAAREAKVHTSWMNPHAEYEAALARFIDGLLGARAANRFIEELEPLQRRIARHGAINSLAASAPSAHRVASSSLVRSVRRAAKAAPAAVRVPRTTTAPINPVSAA